MPYASPFHALTLKQRARVMRHSPTASEQLLWQYLKGQRLGVQFRRQVPLAQRYIVDFLAPSVKLVVEVDGGYHEQRVRLDAVRDARLARLGYRVLRLSHELVLQQPEVAVEVVRRAMG